MLIDDHHHNISSMFMHYKHSYLTSFMRKPYCICAHWPHWVHNYVFGDFSWGKSPQEDGVYIKMPKKAHTTLRFLPHGGTTNYCLEAIVHKMLVYCTKHTYTLASTQNCVVSSWMNNKSWWEYIVSSELKEFLRHKYFKWKHEIRFPPPKKCNASPLERPPLNVY
jgi:hypothetical protein